jgi:hypothetical protein
MEFKAALKHVQPSHSAENNNEERKSSSKLKASEGVVGGRGSSSCVGLGESFVPCYRNFFFLLHFLHACFVELGFYWKACDGLAKAYLRHPPESSHEVDSQIPSTQFQYFGLR